MSDEGDPSREERPGHEVWSDEQWQLYVAKLPPILRPADHLALPDWMIYRFGGVPKRFDTHFFFAEMPEGQQATHDQMETVDGVWIRPQEALSRFEQGSFPLVFATIHQLQALAELGSIDEVRRRFASGPLPTIRPRVVEHAGKEVIVIGDAPTASATGGR
jgi:hypothetical protein